MILVGQVDYAQLIVEKIAYTCIKISVLLFYRRIFITPTFRFISNVATALIIAWGIAFLFAEAFDCGSDSHNGHPCARSEWTVLWFAITDVISDLVILAMPYPMINMLQMSKKEKIGLSGLFLLGALSVKRRAAWFQRGFTAEPS